MTREQAMQRLAVSLEKAIEAWMAGESDSEEWEQTGWIGHNLSVYMARAAMACLESSRDVQDLLKRDGHLTDAAT